MNESTTSTNNLNDTRASVNSNEDINEQSEEPEVMPFDQIVDSEVEDAKTHAHK